MHSPVVKRDYFSAKLAAFYAALGLTTGIGTPFFPSWLETKGIGAAEIGVIMATPMLVRIVFMPLTTRFADRFNVWRGALLICCIGAAIGNSLLNFMNGFIPMVIMIAIAALFFTPTFPLADAYALRGLAERNRAYGPVRLWSSVAFIVGNVGGGFAVGQLGRTSVVWMISAAFVAGALIATRMPPATPHQDTRVARAPGAKSLWRSPAFITVTLACSIVQATHAFYYGFSTISWTAKGLSDTTIGGLWAIGVIAEIILFAVSGRLMLLVGPVALIVLGAAGGVVRWTVMAFDPPFVLLPLLQCLHALSFGATHIGAMQFLARVAPAGFGATVQGDFAALQAVLFGSAMVVSGVLFRSYGDFGYAGMALLSGIGVVVAAAGYFMRPKDT